MTLPRPSRCLSVALALLLLNAPVLCLADPATSTADALPPNLGQSLRQLIVWHRAQPATLPAAQRRARLAEQFPARASRVRIDAAVTAAVVDITLDGTLPLPQVRANLAALGAQVFAADEANRAGSVLSARLPLDAAERAASTPGIRSVALVHRPWRHAGKVTSYGANLLGAERAKGFGYTGAGITVGVLSDSYDAATLDTQGKPLTVHANDDVASGDLPGKGTSINDRNPVFVLADADPADPANTDEGRAMLQIVHDLAPAAALAFATAGDSPEQLAENLRRLRTDPAAHCDILVDDVLFPQEPMFYDGVVARAVDDVTHRADLPGRNVLYYSAAGNHGDFGYAADFQAVPDADARAGGFKGNLRLDQVPTALTAGGFQVFATQADGRAVLGQRALVKGGTAEISLQWDDPPGGGTDYNLLVFDAQGNYLPDLSGTDHNPKMGNSLELIDLPAGTDGGKAVYQLAISRAAGPATGTAATRLRYVVDARGTFTARFTDGHRAPTLYGHPAAPGADAVAAYFAHYYAFPETVPPEHYTSLGPATILFDRAGARLATPEVRQQPTLAAVDAVNNTFFGPDVDGDGHPNFFGTSAAASHAAACAALLLSVAGGPGSLSNQQVRTLLQDSALEHLADPNVATATLTKIEANSTVTLQMVRDDFDAAGSKRFFRVAFTGPDAERLTRVTVAADYYTTKFDPVSAAAPFTVGATTGHVRPEDVYVTVDSTQTNPGVTATHSNRLTLHFAPGSFAPGDTLDFGVGISAQPEYRNVDPVGLIMSGTNVTARLAGPSGKFKVAGYVTQPHTTDYAPTVGRGRIDVATAILALQTDGPARTDDSRKSLTPGNLLLTTGDGRIIETNRRGGIVQVFDRQNTPGLRTGGTLPNQSTVLADGRVATLDRANAMLVILDPVTRTTHTVTYPGLVIDPYSTPYSFYEEPANHLASIGNYVFIHNDAVGTSRFESGSLLRYDAVQDTWQRFGGEQFTAVNPGKYYALTPGRDGLLYAVATGPDTSAGNAARNEIYDPNTLQLLGTFPKQLGYVLSVRDGAGNAYVGDSREIMKYDAAGNYVAQLFIDGTVSSLQLDPDGSLFYTGYSSLARSDATLAAPVRLNPFSSPFDPYGDDYVSLTVALIGP